MKAGDVVTWLGEPTEVISVYSRADALRDGALVDVSELAREAGFTVPVAVTAAVWAIVEPNEGERAVGQDTNGRLWDLLSMARLYGRMQTGRDVAYFPTIFVFRRREQGYGHRRTERFKLVIGPGDNGEPVVTILRPHED